MPFLMTELFHLQQTLASGQLFRYWQTDGGMRVAHAGNIFTVSQARNKIKFSGISRKQLTHFFRLDEDHTKTRRQLSQDTLLKEILMQAAGLRILRQDPWECSISFICSSCSTIKRIRRNLETLSQKYGAMTDSVSLFPTQQQLPRRIVIGAGFREAYLAKARDLLTTRFFAGLQQLPYATAKHKLMEVPGIGAKVADCILLFSLGRLEAFPVDVWIKRVMEEHYFDTRATEQHIAEFGRNHFGQLAGYAQQYLYHWRRNHDRQDHSPYH